jgi:hypothetical protein
VTAELPQCPVCGARHATANRFDGCCCWPCADRMTESRNRAGQAEPEGAKGTAQPPSPHARTDPASSSPARDRGRQSVKRGRSSKRNALVRRVVGYRQFFNAVAALDKPLSVGAVAVWVWLWTCERKGRARLSVRRLAQRFRVNKSSTQRWVDELEHAGLIQVIRRGRHGRSATVVAVYYSPRRQTDDTCNQEPSHRWDATVPQVGHEH